MKDEIKLDNVPVTLKGDITDVRIASIKTLDNSITPYVKSIISLKEKNIIFKATEKTASLYNKTNTVFKTISNNPIIQKAISNSAFETSNSLQRPHLDALIAWSNITKEKTFLSKNIKVFSTSNNNLIYTIPEESIVMKSMRFTSYAEKSLSTITSQNLGSKLYLNNETKRQLTSSFNTFSESYTNLNEVYKQDPFSFIKLNPALAKIAPIHFFSTANLFEAVSVEEKVTVEEEVLKNEIKYENEILLSEYLPKIDPGLYNMWKGAVESLHSDNSDKIRHFITSIRELFTHVIHNLAPDSEIKKWTSDPANYHENKPTRKSRLKFICRNLDNGSFADFLEKDISTTIAFIGVFQSGTHKINSDFTKNQLHAIKSKAESTLKHLFEINLNN